MADSSGSLRTALVGCGRMGARTPLRVRNHLPPGWLPLSHAEAIISTPGLKLSAVCDLDPKLAKDASERHGGVPYTDFREMIKREQPDILAVATRTAPRCEIIRYACEHGVRGLHVEKPFSLSLDQAKTALASIHLHNVALTYGATRRFMKIFRVAGEMFANKEVGEEREISVEFGKAPIMWSHAHSVDLIQFFAADRELQYIQATCTVEPEAVMGDVVDADPILSAAIFGFSGGPTGLITSSGGMNVHLSGEDGRISVIGDGRYINQQRRPDPEIPHYLSEEIIEVATDFSGTQIAFQELRDAVASGRTNTSIKTGDLLQGLRMLFGMVLSSIRGGVRVRPEEVEDQFTVTGRIGTLFA